MSKIVTGIVVAALVAATPAFASKSRQSLAELEAKGVVTQGGVPHCGNGMVPKYHTAAGGTKVWHCVKP